ncbi:hypothetical protein HDC90_001116 [Pedobacter sp. AK013]|uniref:hypothetical protein n=1 Tax=Pedobacter sp. AK013 TaxID=2723071 RepID=UPI001620FE88|nr:hypothetical protein [Pedobacter sp. AK013]MBB6236504.1 hypothetical protein [Pedobacter sp. AK013]
MSIVSRQEFAKLCGDTVNALNAYIGRGKIIFMDESKKKIDTDHPINKAHLKNRIAFLEKKQEQQNLLSSIGPNPRKPPQEFLSQEEDDIPESFDPGLMTALLSAGKSGGKSGGDDDYQKWVKMKIRGDAEYISLKVETEKIKLSKAAGESLPIEIALNAHRIYLKTIVTAFENSIMNMANKFCHIMAAGDMAMYTKIVEECRYELNRCVADAGGDTNIELEKMIKEFSGKNKGR